MSKKLLAKVYVQDIAYAIDIVASSIMLIIILAIEVLHFIPSNGRIVVFILLGCLIAKIIAMFISIVYYLIKRKLNNDIIENKK